MVMRLGKLGKGAYYYPSEGSHSSGTLWSTRNVQEVVHRLLCPVGDKIDVQFSSAAMRVANGSFRFKVLRRSHLPQQGCGGVIAGVEFGSCNRELPTPEHSSLAKLAIGNRRRRFETCPRGTQPLHEPPRHTRDTPTGWVI